VTKVLVHPGICGFDAFLEAKASENVVKLQIKSECEDVSEISRVMPEVSLHEAINTKGFPNKIYEEAARCTRHLTCPIPCAIMKAIEVELGLALKKNVEIKFI
jgi:hypothetical protein